MPTTPAGIIASARVPAGEGYTGNGKGGKGMERMREGIKWKGGERANFLKVALNK